MFNKISNFIRLSLIGFLLVASAPVMADQDNQKYNDDSDETRIEIIEKELAPTSEIKMRYVPPADNADQANKDLKAVAKRIVQSL